MLNKYVCIVKQLCSSVTIGPTKDKRRGTDYFTTTFNHIPTKRRANNYIHIRELSFSCIDIKRKAIYYPNQFWSCHPSNNTQITEMDFYYSPRGSGCRTVIMVAKALGVKLNMKLLNTLEKDQLKPEFVKLNP